MKLSAFSMLNKIFCSEVLFKKKLLVVWVFIVMKSKSIVSGTEDKIFGHIFSIFEILYYFFKVILIRIIIKLFKFH